MVTNLFIVLRDRSKDEVLSFSKLSFLSMSSSCPRSYNLETISSSMNSMLNSGCAYMHKTLSPIRQISLGEWLDCPIHSASGGSFST